MTEKFYSKFFDSQECMVLKIFDQRQTKLFEKKGVISKADIVY